MHTKNILVTGGAGFIGSNLVDALLADERVGKVRVLDNLLTSSVENIQHVLSNPRFEWIEGDIRDFDTCMKAMKGMDLVDHQAALGSVPRSINDPVTTNGINIGGTLNVFEAARQSGIKRVVYAASSSTYGDHPDLPKVEDKIGKPLSPYAVTKLVNELYADVYGKLYGMEFIGLRYFNIFGPRQSPKGAYAAVIPLFMQCFLEDKAPQINGDGTFSRDFTYVANAVLANRLALFTEDSNALNQIYNIACGHTTSLNQMVEALRIISGKDIQANHGPNRRGDIPHSLADISKAQQLLGYQPQMLFQAGLTQTYQWFLDHQAAHSAPASI
ncbi:MAG: SDR family oxidoreductase [Saprospiraceae bacterium]|nr:SDR family oxidoreductase [Saprospiraceae bacterium]